MMNESMVFKTSDWQSGWVVEQEGDHFEVYYTPTERMRIGADGSLSFGGPKPYIFQTREWAELCAKRLNILDAAFGRGPASFSISYSGLGIGTTAPAYQFVVQGGTPRPKPLVTIGQGGEMTIDLPAIVLIWWKKTKAYRAWRVLMWGEKA